MANEEQLEILRRGVKAWNRWRAQNPNIKPWLSGADLNGAWLHGWYDGGVNLSEADLSSANLRTAELNFADLRGAQLMSADLYLAKLNFADLRGAFLASTNLHNTSLHGAKFKQALANDTIFTALDLQAVEGLADLQHTGPSEVSVSTIYRSEGQIPEEFLRGCGLSDWQIEAAKLYRPDLTNQELGDILYRVHDLRAQRPLQISSLFISYSHADGPFVEHLEYHLTKMGIRFWRDVHHTTAGRLEKQVDRAIRLNPTVLLVLSESAVESDWVEHEVRLARRLEKETGRDILCPVALDGSWKECRWPERLREQIEEYNILDFSGWQDVNTFDRVYRRLIEGLDLFYRKDAGET